MSRSSSGRFLNYLSGGREEGEREVSRVRDIFTVFNWVF